MKFIELFDDENDPESGINKISFVKFPAIETNFIYFNKQEKIDLGKGKKLTDTQMLLDAQYGWRYWKVDIREEFAPELITHNSHAFCIKHAGKVFTIDQIHDFHTKQTAQYELGWMTESNFCEDFQGTKSTTFNLDNQLFNCRHHLTAVRDINEVPKNLLSIKNESHKVENFSFNFSVSSNDEQVVKGVALIPDQLIYRKMDGDEFYVYMTKETIKKLKDKFGFSRAISLEHQDDITGNAILLDSWIYDGENDNCGVKDLKLGSWCMSYKIINPKLWELVKNKVVQGFSIEAKFEINK